MQPLKAWVHNMGGLQLEHSQLAISNGGRSTQVVFKELDMVPCEGLTLCDVGLSPTYCNVSDMLEVILIKQFFKYMHTA